LGTCLKASAPPNGVFSAVKLTFKADAATPDQIAGFLIQGSSPDACTSGLPFCLSGGFFEISGA